MLNALPAFPSVLTPHPHNIPVSAGRRWLSQSPKASPGRRHRGAPHSPGILSDPRYRGNRLPAPPAAAELAQAPGVGGAGQGAPSAPGRLAPRRRRAAAAGLLLLRNARRPPPALAGRGFPLPVDRRIAAARRPPPRPPSRRPIQAGARALKEGERHGAVRFSRRGSRRRAARRDKARSSTRPPARPRRPPWEALRGLSARAPPLLYPVRTQSRAKGAGTSAGQEGVWGDDVVPQHFFLVSSIQLQLPYVLQNPLTSHNSATNSRVTKSDHG